VHFREVVLCIQEVIVVAPCDAGIARDRPLSVESGTPRKEKVMSTPVGRESFPDCAHIRGDRVRFHLEMRH